MIDFAHLNDYILLTNFKLQNLRRVMSSILSANLEHKITISQCGTTVA